MNDEPIRVCGEIEGAARVKDAERIRRHARWRDPARFGRAREDPAGIALLGGCGVERDGSDGGREDDRESANEICTHGRNVPTSADVRQSSMRCDIWWRAPAPEP